MRLNTLLGARLPLSNSEAGAVPSRPLVSARTPGERTHSRALRPALAPYVIGTLARFLSRFHSPPAFFPRSVSLLSPPRCILASVPSQLPFRADFDACAFVLCSPAAHGLAGRVRRPPLQRPAVSATWLIRRRQQGEAPAGRGGAWLPFGAGPRGRLGARVWPRASLSRPLSRAPALEEGRRTISPLLRCCADSSVPSISKARLRALPGLTASPVAVIRVPGSHIARKRGSFCFLLCCHEPYFLNIF